MNITIYFAALFFSLNTDHSPSLGLFKWIFALVTLAAIITTIKMKSSQSFSSWLSRSKQLVRDNPISEYIFKHDRRLNILVYGHSASGKTTLIRNMFTAGTGDTEMTEHLEIHNFLEATDINKRNNVYVTVSDYQGQAPAQIIEAIEHQEEINCILFIVDVAPAYSEANIKYSREEIIDLMTKDSVETINKRVKEHREYLSRFLLQVVFQYAFNPNLNSVFLLINKIDIIEELKQRGVISNDTSTYNFVEVFFHEIKSEINRFCVNNKIPNFRVEAISAANYTNLNNIKNQIIRDCKPVKNERK